MRDQVLLFKTWSLIKGVIRMKRVFIIGLVTLIVAGAMSSITLSQGFGPRSRGFGHGMAGWTTIGNDLTQEQLEKLQSIRADFDREMLEIRNNIRSKSQELQKLWVASELDEGAILAKAKEISNLQRQLQERMIRYRLDTAKILTKEQRTCFSPAYCYELSRCWYGGRFGIGKGCRNW